tara:strand:+ start:2263 stop:3237 length:975 start_codon:yes stop_codon:yes gene_type:complete
MKNLKLDIFTKQIKIFFRLNKNYIKFVTNKSLYFYFFIIPVIGYFFYLILRLLVLINSKYLNKYLSQKIFFSSLRFVKVKEKIKISNLMHEYNSYNKEIDLNKSIGNKKISKILEELNSDGISNLGVLFSKQQCNDFINFLENKTYFNSQTLLQSDGNPHVYNKNQKNLKSNSYLRFGPDINNSFEPLRNLTQNEELNELINSYLNFKSSIYFNTTWYNAPDTNFHYVHRMHRDYDDWKFLVITIYWNDVDEKSAPLGFVKESHKNSNCQNLETKITGPAGTVIIADYFALHKGNVGEKSRYVSTIRYGKSFNYSSVICGFLEA